VASTGPNDPEDFQWFQGRAKDVLRLETLDLNNLTACLRERADSELCAANCLAIIGRRIHNAQADIWDTRVRGKPPVHMHAELAEASNAMRSSVLRRGIVPLAITAMATHSKSERVLREGTQVLSVIAAGAHKHKQAVVEAGGLAAAAAAVRADLHGSTCRCELCLRMQHGGVTLFCNCAAAFPDAVLAADGKALVEAAIERKRIGDPALITYAESVLTSCLQTHSCSTGEPIQGGHIQANPEYMAKMWGMWNCWRVHQAGARPKEGFDNLGKACATCGKLPPGWPPPLYNTGGGCQPTHTTLSEAPEAGGWAKCAACEVVRYCGKDCQRAGWKLGHKQSCGSPLPLATSVPKEQAALILGLKEFGAGHAGLASSYAIALVVKMRGQEALPGAADAINGVTSAFPEVGGLLAVLGWPIFEEKKGKDDNGEEDGEDGRE
tara:strand:- start:83 stop:1396 length:1314 start_codon:yes stop_codon:yes gene_type:complete